MDPANDPGRAWHQTLDHRRGLRRLRSHRGQAGPDRDGAAEGMAYFSPDGPDWQYAATIGADGGWTPGVVKGSDYGLVVTGTTASGR